MKTKTKHSTQVVSRATQKILIIAAGLAFLAQAGMQAYYTIRFVMDGHVSGMDPFAAISFFSVILPILLFVILYKAGNVKATRLWRATQAVIITLLALIAEGVFVAVTNLIFRTPLGYGEEAMAGNAFIYQLPPVMLAIAAAVGAGLWIKLRTNTSSDASHRLQKLFVLSLPVLLLAQSIISLFGFTYGGATDYAATNPSAWVDALSAFIVPAIIVGVIYLISSKQRTKLQRLFIAMIYLAAGFLLVTTIVGVAFQAMYATSMMINDTFANGASIFGLLLFIGILAWHKKKKYF